MHRNADVFENPEAFDPTRFLDGTLERSPSFVPFGHGPRNCVAQGMAMQQLMAIVAGTLREHGVVGLQDKLPEMLQQPFLALAPFQVLFEKA